MSISVQLERIALSSVSEMPSDMILEGLYRSKLQNSGQLQTVLVLYDQETAQNNWRQLLNFIFIRWWETRNFRFRNDVVERGSVTKSQQGKKAYVERKVGECFQWRHMDNVPKETRVVSVTNEIHRREGQSSSPAPYSRPRLTAWEKNPQRIRQQRWKLFRQKGQNSVPTQKM